jgi:hypothetical protein
VAPQDYTSYEKYSALKQRESEIFLANTEGIPKQVFMPGFNDFRFVEFDMMMASEFWSVLKECAESCGDSDISVMVHDPDPEHFYFSKFNRYGALQLPLDTSASDYVEALADESGAVPFDAFLYVASVISWCGSSKTWGFWGDRAYGVGIAATCRPDMVWPSIDGIKWFDIDGALSDLISLNFRGYKVPASFEQEFRRSYQAVPKRK